MLMAINFCHRCVRGSWRLSCRLYLRRCCRSRRRDRDSGGGRRDLINLVFEIGDPLVKSNCCAGRVYQWSERRGVRRYARTRGGVGDGQGGRCINRDIRRVRMNLWRRGTSCACNANGSPGNGRNESGSDHPQLPVLVHIASIHGTSS